MADLLDCFDHPSELEGLSAYAILADFMDFGTLARCPDAIRSASRLTLGTSMEEMSADEARRMGEGLVGRVLRLHYYRLAEVERLVYTWDDGKFRLESTCSGCNTDPWEVFLLTFAVALKQHGTKYIDQAAASDTSSDASSDLPDDHAPPSTASAASTDVRPDRRAPYKPRRHPRNLVAAQPFLTNYATNAYLLRIVSMDSFSTEPDHGATRSVCRRCGYRFDGNQPLRTSRFWLDIEHAVAIARRQIRELPECVDLLGLSVNA